MSADAEESWWPMEHMFFSSWMALGRIALVGTLAYAGLVILLRVSGKRTLAKMNAFDFVVTIAFGSTLATIVLSRDVALADGLAALALLIVLQFGLTWSSVRWPWVRRLVTGEPSLLYHRGHFLEDALRRARVTDDELRAAVRGAGHGALDDIEAVVFETDGSFSVMSNRGTRPTPEGTVR